MDEILICQLRQLLNRGVRLAWAEEDRFHEFKEIRFVNNEERAIFADGSGRYVDLCNVSPVCVVKFDCPFSSR